MTNTTVKFNPKLTAKECRRMNIKGKRTTIPRLFFSAIYRLSNWLKFERLGKWSYMKWLNTYADEPFGFWLFAADFLDCEFTDDDLALEA